jgi:hypothetical protein
MAKEKRVTMSERKIVSGEKPKKHAARKQINPKTAEPIM